MAVHDIDILRCEGKAASDAAKRAGDEMTSLQSQLDDITQSRAWWALSCDREIRSALPGRAHRSGT